MPFARGRRRTRLPCLIYCAKGEKSGKPKTRSSKFLGELRKPYMLPFPLQVGQIRPAMPPIIIFRESLNAFRMIALSG